jgi:transposase-like protein
MKKHSAELKYQVVIEMLATKTPVAEICRKYNVNSTYIYDWKKKFLEGGKAALTGGRGGNEAALAAENEQLKGIVADLSLANSTFKKILGGRR